MAGGLGRVSLDHVNDYLPLRRSTFDIELAPLPRSLPVERQVVGRLAARR